MKTCQICRGSRKISLPLHYEVTMCAEKAFLSGAPNESYRTYDCPECSSAKPTKGLALLGAQQMVSHVDIEHSRGEVVTYVKRSMAHMLADELLKSGMISFTEGDGGFRGMKLQAQIAVGSADSAALLDKEMDARASEMLNGIAEAATTQISQWGSDFSGDSGPISKSMAIDFVRQAFGKHMAKVRERLSA